MPDAAGSRLGPTGDALDFPLSATYLAHLTPASAATAPSPADNHCAPRTCQQRLVNLTQRARCALSGPRAPLLTVKCQSGSRRDETRAVGHCS